MMTAKTNRPVGSIRSVGESVFDLAPAQAKRLKSLMKAHLAASPLPENGAGDLMWHGPKQNVLDWITCQESLLPDGWASVLVALAKRIGNIHDYWPIEMIFQNAAEIKELM